MADLLTHVLVGFVIAVVLSWRFAWITPPFIAVAMVGAAIPDLNRMQLLVHESSIEAMLGVPWSWSVFHRAGGALLVVMILTVLVRREYMVPVSTMLLIGVSSHFLLDYGLWQASGRTSLMLWPITDAYLDVGGFYRSSDRWPMILALVASVLVIVVDHRVMTEDVGAD